ncbi:peptide-methionine (S)-S-oxide reductase MsrA [Lactococcus termiticola]|uniref:Peptide methionine sulfoxide reductase MsrA n=1 Tax=Lactococcus termiticola TaxID=2169526 RepID=A0A2R5HG22_9LACT|nr:peptide-methionine (S)-S-oxide reductase MsrA [Lactococcus termiticola]GBG96942.1 peptide methionine sulfoxide reductase [Lactococcus termiticola]
MAIERAIFGGGCFWCMVEPFDQKPGVISVLSGFSGGHVDNPTYDQVIGHYTGHVEVVEILFDNEKLSYQELLDIYWSQVDPTDADGQFLDRGDNYRPVIFVESEEQKKLAEASKAAVEASGIYNKPIVVAIEPASTFWPAEDYHQDWYKRNPERYHLMHKTRDRIIAGRKVKSKFFGLFGK